MSSASSRFHPGFRWWTVVLLTVGLCGAVLAACTILRQPQTAPMLDVGALGSSDIAATPRTGVVVGGELRIALPSPHSGAAMVWNPWSATASSYQRSVMAPVMPTFFTSDDQGRLRFNPDYLASEPTATGNPLTVTLRLNPRAVWNDGTTINWLHVKAPLDACRTNGAGCVISGVTPVASVTRGRDDYEAVVKFNGPYDRWREILAAPGRIEQFGVVATTPSTSIQSGPFVVERYEPSTGMVQMVRNPRWWGELPALERITFRWLDSADALTAFANHEVDVVWATDDTRSVTSLRATPEASVRQARTNNQRTLIFNTTAGTLADPVVRHAITAALDRTAIGLAAMSGVQPPGVVWPAQIVNNRFFTASEPGYLNNSSAAPSPIDPGAALTAAGWQPGPDKIRVKNGHRLSIALLSETGAASGGPVDVLASNLSSLGVEVTWQLVSHNDLLPQLRSGSFAMALVEVPAGQLPQVGYSSTGQGNFSRFSAPGLDQDLAIMARSVTTKDGIAAANRSDQLLWAEAVNVPLYYVPQTVGVRSSLLNYGAAGAASVDWTLVGWRA